MAHGRLADMRVAFLLTNGFEDSELTSPWDALVGAGAQPVLISPESGVITGKKGHRATVDIPLDLARPDLFDALVLPGGRVNAEHLRTHERAVAFVQEFFESTKPVGAICHGGLILAKAGVIRGRTLTSYPSIADDLRAAGATWVDEEVVVDQHLVSSRRPADLPAFESALIREFRKV